MSATAIDTTQATNELHDRALEVVRAVMQPALLEEARQLLNAAGIGKARANVERLRQAVLDAPDMVSNARVRLTAAQDRERTARETHDAALAEAEWLLDSRFVTESNKTWLVTWHRDNEVSPAEAEAKGWKRVTDGGAVADSDDHAVWEERRAMTADERAAWRKRTAADAHGVKPLASDLRGAETALLNARVDVDTEENRWQAARAALTAAIADLEAACAEVACLARALGGGS